MNLFTDTMDRLNDEKVKDTRTTVYFLGKLVGGKTDIMDAVVKEGERTLNDFKRRTDQSKNEQEIVKEQCNLLAQSNLSVDAFLQALNQRNKPLIDK